MRVAGPTLDFGILGPFEIRVDGRAVALTSPKQAALLAILLLHRNEVVTTDRLRKDLWDGDQPRTAKEALHVHVSHLRRLLGPYRASLATSASGYSLAVEGDAVDADRFIRCVERARQAMDAKEFRTASSELRRGLALWRGPALADFSSHAFAKGEIRRLEELRLDAIEDRIHAELALGAHADLVGELEAHVAEHPLRERPRRQLMLALYRSGRQAEALEVFRSAREKLINQLGIEPSRPLHALQQAILRQEPALDFRPGKAAGPKTGSRRAKAFVGRDRELRELTQLLATKSPSRLVTLTGPGGVGKTRLAAELTGRMAGVFEGGVCLVDLTALSDPELVGPSIAKTLGVDEAGRASIVESLMAHFAGKRSLVVLDNFEHVLPARELVVELLSSVPRLSLVVTSRRPLELPEEHRYPVLPLTPQYAIALFVERAVAAVPDFELDDANAPRVADICGRLDGLPLAVELAAARLRLLSPDAIASRLERPLTLLTSGAADASARHGTLRASIDWSYDLLSPTERTLYAALSVFAGGWSAANVEALHQDRHTDVLKDLDALVLSCLVYETGRPDGEPRFAMLQTIRDHAVEKLEKSGEADELRRRHAEYFIGFAEKAEPALTGGDEQSEWLGRLDREYDNLRSALEWCAQSANDLPELRLAGALRRFWLLSGRASEGRRWLEDALAKSTEVRTELRAKTLLGASSLARMQGDYAGAGLHGEQAHELYSQLGDRASAARALSNLGGIAACVGDHGRAAVLYEEGITLLREAGDAWGLAVSLTNLADLGLARGDSKRAAELFAESLALYRERGDRHGVEVAVSSLAVAKLRGGDVEGALPLLAEAFTLAAELGDKEGIARCLEDLAAALVGQGDHEQAARVLGRAEAAREEIGSSRTPFERTMYEETLSAVRGRLNAEAFDHCLEDGRRLDPAHLLRVVTA